MMTPSSLIGSVASRPSKEGFRHSTQPPECDQITACYLRPTIFSVETLYVLAPTSETFPRVDAPWTCLPILFF